MVESSPGPAQESVYYESDATRPSTSGVVATQVATVPRKVVHPFFLRHNRKIEQEVNELTLARDSISSRDAPLPDAESQHARGKQTHFPQISSVPLCARPRGNGSLQDPTPELPDELRNFIFQSLISKQESYGRYITQGLHPSSITREEYLRKIPREHIIAHPAIRLILDSATTTSDVKSSRISTFGLSLSQATQNKDDGTRYQLWADKYRPKRAADVLGNEKNALYLRDWLQALKLAADFVVSVPPVPPVKSEVVLVPTTFAHENTTTRGTKRQRDAILTEINSISTGPSSSGKQQIIRAAPKRALRMRKRRRMAIPDSSEAEPEGVEEDENDWTELNYLDPAERRGEEEEEEQQMPAGRSRFKIKVDFDAGVASGYNGGVVNGSATQPMARIQHQLQHLPTPSPSQHQWEYNHYMMQSLDQHPFFASYNPYPYNYGYSIPTFRSAPSPGHFMTYNTMPVLAYSPYPAFSNADSSMGPSNPYLNVQTHTYDAPMHTLAASLPTSSEKVVNNSSKRFITANDANFDPQKTRNLTNTIVIVGPHGSGKTSSVYACAQELGFEVFEVYPGIGRRNGASVDGLIGEVGRNHIVRKGLKGMAGVLDKVKSERDTQLEKGQVKLSLKPLARGKGKERGDADQKIVGEGKRNEEHRERGTKSGMLRVGDGDKITQNKGNSIKKGSYKPQSSDDERKRGKQKVSGKAKAKSDGNKMAHVSDDPLEETPVSTARTRATRSRTKAIVTSTSGLASTIGAPPTSDQVADSRMTSRNAFTRLMTRNRVKNEAQAEEENKKLPPGGGEEPDKRLEVIGVASKSGNAEKVNLKEYPIGKVQAIGVGSRRNC